MVTLGGRPPVCADPNNAPTSNNLLESYDTSSRCFTHGRNWVNGGTTVPSSGGGCYQVRRQQNAN